MRQTSHIERAFMYDRIEKSKSLITFLKGKLRALWQEVRQFLSFFDFIRFCRYRATIDKRKERELSIKNERKLKFLFQQRFGNMAKPNTNTIINLSTYKLCPTKEFVLSHGLNFVYQLTVFNEKRSLPNSRFSLVNCFIMSLIPPSNFQP